jgi:hypothetical protein
MDNRELWMAATLIELADTSQADFDETTYSRRLAARLADLLDPAETAVFLADGTGRLRVAAASAEQAYRLAYREADRAGGPAATCYRTGRAVPGESPAAGSGIVSFLPMRRNDETVGVVGVTGLPPAGRHTLDRTLASLAQSLAEVAAVAISQQRELRRSTQTAEQLRHALDSRVLIEQAKGAAAARLGITPEAAFELLRAFARRNNRPLAGVAAEAIGGELAMAELVAVPRAGHGGRSGSPVRNG